MCMDQNLQERAQLPWFTYLFTSHSFSTYHVIDAVMLMVILLSTRIEQSRTSDTKYTCVAHAK